MFAKDHTLANVDPELWGAIQKENTRQQDHIELIASENYTSPAVMEAQGSQLTNKYAEGYPGKRYYGGCEFVDVAEQLAIDRVKQLFGAEAANVQANSGSQANQGVFFAMLKPGDTIMGMSLAEGGHLTHGMALNMSGKWFNVVIFPGIQGGPLMHVIAGKAVAFKEALTPEFREYQKQVVKNAKALAEALTSRGLRIVSGRTESHVMLVDLRAKGLTGKEAEAILGQAHMTCNKNGIPNDPQKPFVTSGIRLGSPAFTTRGFKEEDATKVGNLIADVLDNPHDAATIERVKAEVKVLTDKYPVYAA